MTPEQLKASILQMAIQGKLVEQRIEEGTAEELYQQIQEEKKKLIKEGKIKKEKPLADITEEEIPFDIPESWKWVRTNDIVSKNIKRGKSPTYTELSSVQVFAQKCNVKTGGINMDIALFLNEDKLKNYPDTEYMIDKDIVINSTGGGTMGRVGIFLDTNRKNNMSIVPDSHVTIIRANKYVNPWYLYYILKNFQKYLETMGSGSTNQTELKPQILMNLLIPLPPLEEQHRIVAKIEELLPFIERYAKSYEKLEKFNAKFPADMKKSILQYAIQGKLVEQRTEEGTAEELYQQIQEEKKKLIKEGKIKREKPLAEITEDEIPFDIPDSWLWVRLSEIFNLIMGQSPDGNSVSENPDGMEFHQGKVFFSEDFIQKSDKTTSNPSKVAAPNSVLLCVRAPVGIVNITDRELCIGRGLCDVIPLGGMNERFVLFWLRCFKDTFIKKATGTTFVAITGEVVKNQVIPLPPLEEQHRIVAKIEELLPYCDQLIK